MIRNILKTGGSAAALLFPGNIYDNIKKQTDTEANIDITTIQNESGWDRLKKIFEIDEFGNISKEILTILHVGGMSSFVGAIYGGIIHSRVAYMNFIKNNQATAFSDHIEAKRKLQEKVTLSFGKGAWQWCWRLSLFCTTFVSVTTVISVYRGEPGLSEYVIAGFISGATYKFNMGPRGWIVGGCLGSVLGLIGGGITIGLVKVTGMTMDEARYWQYYWQKERRDYVTRGLKKLHEKEEMEVMQEHKMKVGDDITKDPEVLEKIA